MPRIVLGIVFFTSMLSAQTSVMTSRGLFFTPDVAAQAAKWKRVEIPYNDNALSARERQMVEKLVEASQYINRIYWRQSDPAGLQLYLASEPNALHSTNAVDRDTFKMLRVNGSRYDLLNDNKTY